MNTDSKSRPRMSRNMTLITMTWTVLAVMRHALCMRVSGMGFILFRLHKPFCPLYFHKDNALIGRMRLCFEDMLNSYKIHTCPPLHVYRFALAWEIMPFLDA